MLCIWQNKYCIVLYKDSSSFIAFDVVEFYPSISVKLLNAALEFESKHVTISDDDRYIIRQAESLLLYNAGEPWSKLHCIYIYFFPCICWVGWDGVGVLVWLLDF